MEEGGNPCVRGSECIALPGSAVLLHRGIRVELHRDHNNKVPKGKLGKLSLTANFSPLKNSFKCDTF